MASSTTIDFSTSALVAGFFTVAKVLLDLANGKAPLVGDSLLFNDGMTLAPALIVLVIIGVDINTEASARFKPLPPNFVSMTLVVA